MAAWWAAVAAVFCLSAQALADVGQGCDKVTVGHLRPVMDTHTLPPYPPSAKDKREEGTSLIQVVIAPDGAVSHAELVTSSGSRALDDAAVAHVKAHWRWETQADRCAGPIMTRVSIAWKYQIEGFDPLELAKTVNLVLADPSDYPPTALAAKQSGVTMVVALQPESGGEPSVYVVMASGSDELDQKSTELAKARLKAAQFDGRPIGGSFTLAFIWVLPGTAPPNLDKVRSTMEFFATHQFGAGAGTSWTLDGKPLPAP
jgi:TonB family protein